MEILKNFIQQTRSDLERIRKNVQALETGQEPVQPMATVYKILHIIQGTSSLYGLKSLEELTGNAKNKTREIQNGSGDLSEGIKLLNSYIEHVSESLALLEETGEEAQTSLETGHSHFEKETEFENSPHPEESQLQQIADLVCELALVKNEIFKYKNTIEENEFQRNLNFLGSLSNQILKKLKKVNISPSNFSVTEALVLQSGKNIYAIPLKNTTEILLFHQGKKEKWINSFPGNARFLHHQKDYPLFSLEEILSGNPQNTTDELLQNETSINLVLLNYAGKELALIPEKILDIDYLVVKAPGKVLEGLSLFTGASTTPGGNIVFVINPEFIETYGSEIKKPEIYQTTSKEKTNQELESLLLFETEGKHFAIHTGIIQLVQKIHSDILHLEANPPLIEIRGKEIGLVPLPETIFSPQKEKGSEGYVIVFHKDESLKGIIADNILGTTEEYQVAKVDSNSAPESNHFSILGKSTIKEKDTLLLGI